MLLACTPPSGPKTITYKNEEDTTGFYAARNLKGLASFQIGETTYKQAIKILKDDIRRDYNASRQEDYTGYSTRYNSYSPDHPEFVSNKLVYRESFSSVIKETKFDTIQSYLKEDLLDREVFGCPNLREIRMFEYYIGNIEVRSLKLNFFNDTLFSINANQDDELEKGFIEKYGGLYTERNKIRTPSGIKSEYPISQTARQKSQLLEIDEEYIWENEKVIARSHSNIEYHYEGKSTTHTDFDYYSSFTIETKDTTLLKKILDCKNLAYATGNRLRQEKKQSDFSKL